MNAPLVAVTGRRVSAAGLHRGPPTLDRLEIEAYFSGYADRLVEAGAVPVHVPARVAPEVVLDRVDALVLTGGSDVDPALYGEEALSSSSASSSAPSSVDRTRDDRELALLAAALEHDLPVLAICRGLQLLNVHLGGTLHQHLGTHPVGDDGAHTVTLVPGSALHEVYGPETAVNSVHHQAVAVPGAGLACVGHAPDGVVEAVELPGRPVVGVQWHPEQLSRTDPVFGWLVAATRRSRAGAG